MSIKDENAGQRPSCEDAPTEDNGWTGQLSTHTGFIFQVRPANSADEAALDAFFKHVTADDLRFRFLAALDEVSDDQLALMTNVDHRRTENFLAYDMGVSDVIATAMLAADDDGKEAEVAISVRSDYKHRGIGWSLLEHVARFAAAKGVARLQSIQSREDHEAIELEREMGFTATPYPGDSTLVLLEKELQP